MSVKNPFKLLGLDPDILRRLSDEDIAVIIKSQYRALMQIFFPKVAVDVKENQTVKEKRARDIIEAYSLLDYQKDRDLYESFKQQFLHSGSAKKRISELEHLLVERENAAKGIYQSLLNYLNVAAKEGNSETVFGIGPCTLEMHDYGRHMNMKPASLMDDAIVESEVFYKLMIADDKSISKLRHRQLTSYPNKRLIGTIDENNVSRFGSMRALLPSVGPSQGKKLIHGENPGLFGKYHYERISSNHFERLASLITPHIKEKSYLFALNTGEQPFYFSLEGVIVKIVKDGTKAV